MELKRVYIGGKMSGLQFGNVPIFNYAAEQLRAKGYEVVNPAEVNNESPLDAMKRLTPEEKKKHWNRCMIRDIPAMLSCDTLALLDNWSDSEGAVLERSVALRLDLNVVMVSDLLDELRTDLFPGAEIICAEPA